MITKHDVKEVEDVYIQVGQYDKVELIYINVKKPCEDQDILMCLNVSSEALQMTFADLSGTASTTSTWRGRPGGCPQCWRTFVQNCERLLVAMVEGFVVPPNKSRMLMHREPDLMDLYLLFCRCASHSRCIAGPAANGFGEGVGWKSQLGTGWQVEKC